MTAHPDATPEPPVIRRISARRVQRAGIEISESELPHTLRKSDTPAQKTAGASLPDWDNAQRLLQEKPPHWS